MAGPPDDFNNQPTRHRDVSRNGGPQGAEPPPPPAPDPWEAEASLDPLDDEGAEPTAWYGRPVVLIGWGLMVLILIALIVYGIIELIGDQGTGSTPSTTTTPSHTTTTTTTAPTTTTTAPSTTTATTTAPPSSSAVQAPAHEPSQQPTHRHHWPSWLPTTIPALP